MLASPLRRCLLSNKVLPSDMMVRFELTRPSSPSTGASQDGRLVLVPSRISHPRFEDSPARHGSTGKAMWVTCWADAVSALAQKGSYKRLHSSAVMAPPPAVTAHVHSLLARRVMHESELLAERVKAWPASWVTDLHGAPVRRVARDQLREALRDARHAGRHIVGVLDLASPRPVSEADHHEQTDAAFFASLLERSATAPVARCYRLSTFFRGVILPPSTSTSTSTTSASVSSTSDRQDPEAQLLAATRGPLEGLIELLARRFARLQGDSAPSPAHQGDLFVLSAPGPSAVAGDAAAQRQAEHLTEMLVALERCRLWLGEGWVEEEEE